MTAPTAPNYVELFAALDRFLAIDTQYESTLQMQATAATSVESDDSCYCGYIDPGFPGDPKCVNCEKKEQVKKKRLAADLAASAEKEMALPEGHPERIFTDAEIRDVAHVHCDKRGLSRLLLREIRKRMGIKN